MLRSLELSLEKTKATTQIVRRANKVLMKLKKQKHSIFSTKLGEFSQIELHVQNGASSANLPDSASSAGGYTIFLSNNQGNGFCSLLSWTSVKIGKSFGSTLKAEMIGAAISKGTSFSDFYVNDCNINHIPVIRSTGK